ncbi:DNA-directed RNA polymerase III subunit 2-like [Impatiens glandulifera]|uniref:DNA-directed RNA polymerase III subunit 2-like n=1 Tax=Impatiens glandulifera TaxID=253017 RepID=UPI001FB04CEC|nr:DNA-directed RNA polymerase III subunit 2-like [Impatiens glandulifera]
MEEWVSKVFNKDILSMEAPRIHMLCEYIQEMHMVEDQVRVNIGMGDPVKSQVDKYKLIPEYLQRRGLAKEQLHSYNYFINIGIKKIVQANDRIVSKADPSVSLRYTDIWIDEKTMLKPKSCRLSDATYDAPILVKIEYTNGRYDLMQSSVMKTKTVPIGRMPVMLKSNRCFLHGKDEYELAKLGECPLDPGGYFVINGSEKVILIQEQLSNNRIFIDNNKGCIQASVTSFTSQIRNKTLIRMEKEKIYVYMNQFTTNKVPIMVVMKAMGMESDQEVVQMLGRDPCYNDLLNPSIEECVSNNVYTQKQALDFLEKKGFGRALYLLKNLFIANVPVHGDNFREKCLYVAIMMRRMMDVVLNRDVVDDKDYVGNKRFELSGQLLSILFEDLFKSMNEEVISVVDKKIGMWSRFSNLDISQHIIADRITHGIQRALSTGSWDINRFRMHRKGITQVVQRLSFIGMVGHMTRVSPQFEKSRKVSGPRALQTSQWGMLCPCDTPESEQCGLVKHLALMTHVTTHEEEDPIITMCYSLGIQNIKLRPVELHSKDSFQVVLNGRILGNHRKPQVFVKALRMLRRNGTLNEFVSVFVNEKHRCVYLASDGGRVCRPLLIAENGASKIKEYHMKELIDGVRTFDDFLHNGLIEYLDVNEENNALIALYDRDVTAETTHIEIEPFTILGVCAGLIPFPHHNQSPRNTYQCAMGKQAMGHQAYNQLIRMDQLMYSLVYPQRPLLTTRAIELVGYDKLGGGQNATVAVMSFTGYDIDDAIVMNKATLDRGFGRCIVMKKMPSVLKKYGNNSQDRIIRPIKEGCYAEKMNILDNDGIASPGEIIRSGDIYVNKQIPLVTSGETRLSDFLDDKEYRDCKQIYKDLSAEGDAPVVIDRVSLSTDRDNNMSLKLMIRHTRRPEIGDKFSSRHGQKGVCGIIINQEQFPYSERGICPDLIMNPHGFPRRMTVGKLIELLGSKAGASCGRFHYGSAFGEPSGHADTVDVISETLVKNGFNYNGKDFLYSGETGFPLQAYIFMGPIYYQRLKHMVMDKIHARGNGPRVMITRQPTEGRARNGGLRVGEMERDCLIAYGASMLIYERLMLASDPFEIKVCKKCGLMGYYNYKLKMNVCSTCKSGENVASLKVPYACKLLFQELQSMNIVPRLKLRDAS